MVDNIPEPPDEEPNSPLNEIAEGSPYDPEFLAALRHSMDVNKDLLRRLAGFDSAPETSDGEVGGEPETPHPSPEVRAIFARQLRDFKTAFDGLAE